MSSNTSLWRHFLRNGGVVLCLFFASFFDRGFLYSQINPVDDENAVTNLSAQVNSSLGDYRPRISTDAKTLYFCRTVRDEQAEADFLKLIGMPYRTFLQLSNEAQKARVEKAAAKMNLSERLQLISLANRIDGHEEIYVASWQSESNSWGEAVSIASINSEGNNEAPESISADNNQFFIFKNGDFYLTRRIGSGWGVLEKLEEPINSSYWDADLCFSADGLTMFFASMRPGFTKDWANTEENIDIWVTVKQDAGWTEPVNLGRAINTSKTDRTPFLHADGKTLYFASDGHSGQGGLDIFKTERMSDSSWTEWSQPVNLTELNTAADEWDLSMPANSEWAYFTSDRAGGYGGYDIYKIRVDSKIAPEGAVTLISGVVTDPNGKPLDVQIRWENLDTGELMGMAISNPVSGEYTIALPAGHHYGYYATKKDYWDKSDNIDLTNLKNYQEFRADIELIPIIKFTAEPTPEDSTNVPKPVEFTNIFFTFNSDTLDKKSYLELDRRANELIENPDAKIEIHGHTDTVGTKAYNLVLSQKRANRVREYLISKGIHPNRLDVKGLGEDYPAGPDASDDKNRRVEFIQIQNFTGKR